MVDNIRTGYERFQLPHQKKFYRGYLAEGGVFRYTLRRFKGATSAGLYALRALDRLRGFQKVESEKLKVED